MEPDSPEEESGEMVKLDVVVPKRLLREIDERATELAYPTRSGFVRDVLGDATEPILTPGAKEGVSQGYVDVAVGQTLTHEEMKVQFGLEDE